MSVPGKPQNAVLTLTAVASIVAWAREHQSRIEVKDLGCPGLVLRAGSGGNASWCYRFGTGGQRLTLGKYPALTLKQARDAAAVHRARLAEGTNPLALKRDARQGMTIETATKRMLEEHIRDLAPRTQKDYEYLLTRHIIPKLGKLRVRDLDKPSVVRWHRGLVTKGRGHRQANFSLAVLSKLFSLAELWGERDEGTNPCYGVPRFREEKRQRYLNPEELRRLTKFLDGTITADCIRLLILTGIRIGELLALTWKQVDFDTRTITFKEHKTGRKVGVKTLPLSAGAVALLKAMPRLLGSPPKVCPETESSLERYWRDVRTRARLENVRLHDLRHTFASYGAARGLSMRTLGGLLGQGHQATTERYAHLDVDPLREATEKISEALEAVMRKQG